MEVAGHDGDRPGDPAGREERCGVAQVLVGVRGLVLHQHHLGWHPVLDQIGGHGVGLGHGFVGSTATGGDQHAGRRPVFREPFEHLPSPLQPGREQRRHASVDQPGAEHHDRLHRPAAPCHHRGVEAAVEQEGGEGEAQVCGREPQQQQPGEQPDGVGVHHGDGQAAVGQQREAGHDAQQAGQREPLPAHHCHAGRDQERGEPDHRGQAQPDQDEQHDRSGERVEAGRPAGEPAGDDEHQPEQGEQQVEPGADLAWVEPEADQEDRDRQQGGHRHDASRFTARRWCR